jgi:hypothetical protein
MFPLVRGLLLYGEGLALGFVVSAAAFEAGRLDEDNGAKKCGD